MTPDELYQSAGEMLREEFPGVVGDILLSHPVQRRYEAINGRLSGAPAREQVDALCQALLDVGALGAQRQAGLRKSAETDGRLLPALHVLIGARRAMVGMRIANNAMDAWSASRRRIDGTVALPDPGGMLK